MTPHWFAGSFPQSQSERPNEDARRHFYAYSPKKRALSGAGRGAGIPGWGFCRGFWRLGWFWRLGRFWRFWGFWRFWRFWQPIEPGREARLNWSGRVGRGWFAGRQARRDRHRWLAPGNAG